MDTDRVSIPAGFSDALRRSLRKPLEGYVLQVSIPAGFSDALRPPEFQSPPFEASMFQSLLGFLMRCDV